MKFNRVLGHLHNGRRAFFIEEEVWERGVTEKCCDLLLSVAGVIRQLVHAEMSRECVSECWIRFLNLLGNPVDLCHPSLISSTPAFLDMAMASDAKDHDSSMKYFPCLRQLPDIFLQVSST